MKKAAVRNISEDLVISVTNTYTPVKNRSHYPHSHDFLELYIHISGEAEYMVENMIWPIDYGSVVITRENELHCIRMTENDVLQNVYCGFERGLFENFAPELLSCFDDRALGQRCVISLPHDMADRCVEKLLEAGRAMDDMTPLGICKGRAEFMSVLAEVNRVWENEGVFKTTGGIRYNAGSMLAGRALALINKHCAEIRTVDDLAARLYVSREHLSRCFSAELGVPVSRYMMTARVWFSAVCLKQGAGLDEVCAKCGWNDYSYFIKVFRREIGMTPAKYREKYSGKR